MMRFLMRALFLKTIVRRFWWTPLVYLVLVRVLPWEREMRDPRS